MKRFLKKVNQCNRGFTLVELLVAIALIAILVAIVMPNITGLIGYGQTEGANAELSTVQTAMELAELSKRCIGKLGI